MNLRQRTLQIAISKIGVKEVGANRGPDVELFLKAASLRPGDAWCAAFVNWSAEQAAKEQNVISPLESVGHQGYVPSYVKYGKDNGWVVASNDVLPGDLFCINSPSLRRYAHIGFVKLISPDKKSFSTVEGNSNDDGSREGVEVCCNIRKVTGNTLFLRWTKVVHPRPGVAA